MSRNFNLRKMAAKLPPFPKKTKDGQFLKEPNGNPIYVDHFQEMKKIQREMNERGISNKSPRMFEEMHKYSRMVLEYDRHVNRKARFWKKVFIYAGIIALAIILSEIKNHITQFIK